VDSVVPAPLSRLAYQVAGRFPEKAEITALPLPLAPGESGMVMHPRREKATPIFVSYAAGSFYVEIGDALSDESSDHVPDADAFAWALALVENAAKFGAFKISRYSRRGRVKSSYAFVPESREELLSVSLGQDERIDIRYEPW